jgi:enamine deaminase RidA (YjgF/YER057c/UK114 family)
MAEGPLLFTAGITARDSNGHVVAVGDIRGQIEQCFRNIGDILHAAGADYSDVIKWTMYTTDIDAYAKHQDAWKKYFINKPASTLLGVSRLAHPDMTVEIEAIARIQPGVAK